MYLQEQLSRKAGNKKYLKYVIVVPPKLVHKLGWKAGRLKSVVRKNRLIIGGNKNGRQL